MREVKLPTGVILGVEPAPFEDAKALYKIYAKELKDIPFSNTTDMASFYKHLLCSHLSSDDIEKKLWPCMKRCLYNGLKIDEGTFEPVKAREDYNTVCFEVTKENLLPFTKNLMQEFSHLLASLEQLRA